MKPIFRKREAGSALVFTLVICLTVGAVLASALGLVQARYKATLRSQIWNSSVPLVEAGIEEAMTHLHEDIGAPTANGWTYGTINGQVVYSKRRDFPDGSYVLVNIYNANAVNPSITATGYVPAPLDREHYVSRTVKVSGVNPAMVCVAFGAVNNIQMNGSGLAADSFNSNDPKLSTNGQYDPNKASTNGNVGSVYGPVNFGNHTIAGSLYLGPSATNISVNAGQVSGKIYSDFNISFPDVALPATAWLPATPTISKKSTVYDFTLSGDYTVTTPSDIVVEPGVNVRLKIDSGNFTPGTISIRATNGVSGSLIIYQVAGTATMSGNVTVDSGRPRHFYYYGLSRVTSVTYGGTSSFIGVIYAPEAALTLNGGGNNNGLIGASISKTITMNGHYNFHYDEDLLTSGPSRGFVMTAWQEL